MSKIRLRLQDLVCDGVLNDEQREILICLQSTMVCQFQSYLPLYQSDAQNILLNEPFI